LQNAFQDNNLMTNSAQRPPKLVLFDLGGVVIDIDFHRIVKFWADAGKVPMQQLMPLIGPLAPSNEAFHQFERGEISSEQFFEATASRTGLNLTPSEWLDGWNAVFIGEYAGTQELLSQLKREGAHLMALSNINVPHHFVTTTRFAPLLTAFERVFYSHEMGLRKPEHTCFQAICQATGFAAKDILFFDDMETNVSGARAAGLQAQVFTQATLARPVIDNFLNRETK
jgi:glucose-1-phosphatase